MVLRWTRKRIYQSVIVKTFRAEFVFQLEFFFVCEKLNKLSGLKQQTSGFGEFVNLNFLSLLYLIGGGVRLTDTFEL